MSLPIESSVRSEVANKMLDKARQAQPQDAIGLLKQEHQEANDLYRKFWDTKSKEERQKIAAKLCLALSVHMRIEEDIFYPAVAQALGSAKDGSEETPRIVPEARVEHDSLKKLISEVESAPEDVEFESRVQVMCEYTKHHIREEESKMLPKAQSCGVDMQELGEQLARRKLELLEEACSEPEQAIPSRLFRESIRSDGRRMQL